MYLFLESLNIKKNSLSNGKMILILNKIKLYTYCSVVFRRRFTYQLLHTDEAVVLDTLTSNNPLQLREAKFLLSRPNTPKHDLLLEVLTLHGNELLVVKPRFEPITSLTTSGCATCWARVACISEVYYG